MDPIPLWHYEQWNFIPRKDLKLADNKNILLNQTSYRMTTEIKNSATIEAAFVYKKWNNSTKFQKQYQISHAKQRQWLANWELPQDTIFWQNTSTELAFTSLKPTSCNHSCEEIDDQYLEVCTAVERKIRWLKSIKEQDFGSKYSTLINNNNKFILY